MMNKTVVALIACLLSACASLPFGLKKSPPVEQKKLSAKSYLLRAHRADYRSDAQATDFLLLRASELTLRHGFRYFAIVGLEKENSSRPPQLAPPVVKAPFDFYGARLTPFNSREITPRSTAAFKPQDITLTVQFFKKKPKNMVASDARNIRTTVRKKYRLKAG